MITEDGQLFFKINDENEFCAFNRIPTDNKNMHAIINFGEADGDWIELLQWEIVEEK